MGDRIPLESKDMNVISGSDSDSSDDDSPPKIRKTRSTRSVRSTLAANPSAKPVPFLKKQVSVYSTRVTKCLEDLKSGRIQLCIDKDEEEIPKADPQQPDVKTDNRVPVVALDDSKDDLECSHVATPESSFVRSRSPTPPPTPDSTVTHKSTRTRRMNRNMKKALKTLEGMKDTIRVHSSSEDEDLVIVSHLCSPTPETTSMTAKIRYKSKIYKYSMMKADTFQSIKTRLAGDIDVEEDHLFLMLADRNILPTDTPISIGLHIADILDCHLYSPGVLDMLEEDIPARDAISLYVQCSNRKNKVLIKISKHQALRKLMSTYATKVKTELSYLKFMFDGEDISPSMTPEMLEMEDMDTIDAIEL
ncbi:NFATC2-interacting protein-like [Haliotis asinina]|uniref:NFATC2-interacting protein-like n=1 Tax=Haliotis asinina TaxID=109174 RepID=UPI0035324369